MSVIRYNLYPSAAINGRKSPDASSGEALKVMEEISARELPPSMGTEWTSIAYQESRVSGETVSVIMGAPVRDGVDPTIFGQAPSAP